MENKIKIDGNGPEWKRNCAHNVEYQNQFDLINCNLEMAAFCSPIAQEHGYELVGNGLRHGVKSGVCRFIPRNYAKLLPLPDGFVFSGNPED